MATEDAAQFGAAGWEESPLHGQPLDHYTLIRQPGHGGYTSDHVHDHQRVWRAHGGRVHDFVGHHLDAYPRDAARVCVSHLCSGVAAAGEQQPHALVGTGLSGLRICDQRVHPDRQSAWRSG
jgi:hypothetical protein